MILRRSPESRRRRPALLVPCLFSLLGLIACGGDAGLQPRPKSRPSILLISIDTLRADHLGCYGYHPYAEPVSPAIDALAAQGTRFTRFHAPRGQTAPSLASMMTGKYPSAHGIRDNGQDFAPGQVTLAEHLGALGYDTAVFVSQLPAGAAGHPGRGAGLVGDGRFHPDGREARGQNGSDAAVEAKALAYLDGRGPEQERPFFLWVHFFAVHKPYAPPPPYHEIFAGDYRGPLRPPGARRRHVLRVPARLDEAALDGRPLAPADHAYVLALYDGGVRATDERVGKILARLAERDLEGETLVILTADHGEELGDHQGYYFHGNSVYTSTLHVPLILRWPGRVPAAASVDLLLQNVDLVPTLLDWLGEPIPPELEGVSFADWVSGSRRGDPPRAYAFMEWQDVIFAARSDEATYLVNPRGAHLRKVPFFRTDRGFQVACQEVYDLATDPLEQRDLHATAGAPETAPLRQALRRHVGRPGQVTHWQTPAGEEVLENLQALGYVDAPTEDRADVLFGAEDCRGR